MPSATIHVTEHTEWKLVTVQYKKHMYP